MGDKTGSAKGALYKNAEELFWAGRSRGVMPSGQSHTPTLLFLRNSKLESDSEEIRAVTCVLMLTPVYE